MGAECTSRHGKEENTEVPLVPPGFESTSFTLRKIQEGMTLNCMQSSHASELRMDNKHCDIISNDTKLKRTLRRKPWINYTEFENSSEEDSDSEQFDQSDASIVNLPKGVIRGCPECSNCQKVIAKWRPEDARRPALDEAPVFYPNEEEFEDTLKYIASIRSRAEPFGICRIVPPPSWSPPCPLREKSMWENAKFATRIQRIDKLQNRISGKKMSRYYRSMIRKRRKSLKMGASCGLGINGLAINEVGHHNYAERFGFEPGSLFTLEAFHKYADDFKEQYFGLKNLDSVLQSDFECQTPHEPTVENIEGEYWRMVEKPTEEIEVLYGADIETGVFGSGFPKPASTQESSVQEDPYVKSGWNLNKVARLPGSLLAFESGDISGVQVPWLYVGMCFSSFCWHVEDHHFYSLNYMHWGAPKIWYGVPGKEALKLEAAMKKHLPDLFEEQPDLLHKLVTQLSPSILKSEGVPVYRCVQNPHEFIVTFPRAYHSGFNCGFNCAEAVNVAPVDWLPHGQSAVELYRQQGRKTSVSHDKLLLGAAREAVRAQWEVSWLGKNSRDNLRWKGVCGENGILAMAVKSRVEMECASRELLSRASQARQMDSGFDATSERECIVCFYDLHLSAAGCQCSPDRYACLNHAQQLCSCPWTSRFFLFRYEVNELIILVEALGGKLSAVNRWAYLKLGLSLSSIVTKGKLPQSSTSMEAAEKGRQESASKIPSVDIGQRLLNGVNPTSATSSSRYNAPVPFLLASSEEGAHQRGLTGLSTSSSKIKTEEQIFPVLQLSEKEKSCVRPSEMVSGKQNPFGSSTSLCGVRPLSISDATKPGIMPGLSSRGGDLVILSDDEDEKSLSNDSSGVLRLTKDGNAISHCLKDQVLSKPEISGTDVSQKDAKLLGVIDKASDLHSRRGKADSGKAEAQLEYNFMMQTESLVRSPSQNDSHNINSKQNINSAVELCFSSRESLNSSVANFGSHHKNLMPHESGKSYTECKDESIALDSSFRLKDKTGSAVEGVSGPLNNFERRQKGPRMAKVVRRINCVVEPLELGVVSSGKLWSNQQTIFPKGFRSRVRYLSVRDPTTMCYYISQILDAGLLGPLFMVNVEQCPSEVFIHISASKCWDLVRERVNDEIRKQHSLARIGLPPLQPPGCIDGLEMFGFTSPMILQVIEAIDKDHVCSDYWKSRTERRNPSPHSPGNLNDGLKGPREETRTDSEAATDPEKQVTVGAETVLRGLFKKANLVELHTLHSLLSDSRRAPDREMVSQLLVEEFHCRPKVDSSKFR